MWETRRGLAPKEEEKLMNCEKVSMIGALVNELGTFKTHNEFLFPGVPDVQSYLKLLPTFDEDSLHMLSVKHEPIVTSGPNYLEDGEVMLLQHNSPSARKSPKSSISSDESI
jgi:hypothetical protein